MPPSPYLPLLLSLLFLSGHSHGSPYAHDNSSCVVSFFCGEVNISYPFYLWDGTSAASYCGYPGLGLTCRPDKTAILQMKSDNYTVTSIDYNTRSMLLADTDVLTTGGDCPKVSHNVTFTPRSPFNYTDADDYLVFFFGCFNLYPPDGVSAILCDRRGFPEESYVFREDQIPPGVDVEYWARSCHSMLVAPVLGDILKSPKAPNLTSWYGEVLMHGFELSWQRNNIQCEQCESTKGRCGYTKGGASATDYVFRCFCPDGLDCGSGTSRYKRIKIGIITGASGLFLLCLLVLASSLCYRNGSLVIWRKGSRNAARVESFLQKYGSSHPKRYTYPEVKRMTKSFEHKLGQGGFGAVYKGNLPDGHQVAVKMLKDPKADGEEFMNEVASISRTSHVNVVTLIGFCLQGSKRALIYDYMPNGSLERFAFSKKIRGENSLGWEKLFEIAVGIARGLEYLHRGCNTRIVHFDIKPHNILLDQDLCPKISDFGLAKLCLQKESIISITGARGTIGYIAPEVFSRQFGAVTSKSDVYSYGMMVLEMVGARKGINANDENSSENYFPQWIYEHLDEYCVSACEISGEASELVRKMVIIGLWCIQLMPTDRPSMSRVVEMLESRSTDLQLPPKYLFN